VQVMKGAASVQFDPALLQAFLQCADKFDQIYRSLPD
jgi:response regulator RpfG family c-di-GMP phosphodiesterase